MSQLEQLENCIAEWQNVSSDHVRHLNYFPRDECRISFPDF